MTASSKDQRWKAGFSEETASVALLGDWVARSGGVEIAAAKQILKPEIKILSFESHSLGRWDSALIAFLSDLRDAAKQGGVEFVEDGLPLSAKRLLGMVANTRTPAPPAAQKASLLEATGRRAISMFAEAVAVAALVGNLPLRSAAAFRGVAATRLSDVLGEMYEAGVAALPIVMVVNLLVGGILAFIGATELRQFGAGIYVANLVGIGMVREMAALMTAIIMAGRTGGAYAANLASMEGAEEIDALRALGISEFDYLVIPRVLALTAMLPILYLFGCAVGILGGLCVGAITLNVTAMSFFVQAQQSLSGVQFVLGFLKSLSFGILIALVACHVGLRADRSAAAVGKAATSAVVAGIVGVIALDAAFDLCANVMGV